MPNISLLRRQISWTLIALLSCALTLSAQSNVKSRPSEQKTAAYFESIRKLPPKQMAFVLKMPKGGDLHNHLSGSIYAERYIQWAADKGLCVNNATMSLSVPSSPSTCNTGQTPANTALTNSVLYRQMVDAWSMRNW